jgi:chemotaxis protein CheZ
MAVQRRTFRIEERARMGAPDAAAADEAETALRHREFMTELQALRALMQQPPQLDRDTLVRARAQIVEAQAYKNELESIHAAVKHTRAETGVLGADVVDSEQTARASRELQAIVAGTERATQTILRAAEEIEQTANALSAVLQSGHERGLAQDIQDRIVKIFEACNFQDLTGQRVAKVVATLKFIEDHVARLQEIWSGIERFNPIVVGQVGAFEHRYLNGPKLPEDRGHSTQDEIDEMFRRA